MRLFEKVDRDFRWKYVLGVGAAVLLAGVTVASYSHQKAVSQKNVARNSLSQSAKQTTLAKANQSAAKMPLTFEPNKGQTDSRVNFVARANGYTVYLTPDAAVLRMKGEKEDGVLQMKLRNANKASRIETLDQQTAKSNYLIGNDRSKWITGVANYGKVAYHSVYPGVDVDYSGNQRSLEYDFVVKPGADPKQIRVAFEGSSRFVLNQQGDIELKTAAGATVAHKPVVYQTIHGQRKSVEANYVLTASNEVGFRLGAYDTRETLIIDPTVTTLSFIGGTGQDQGNAIAVNKTGTPQGVFITGETTSVNTFPLTPNACAPGVNAPCWPTITNNLSNTVASTTPAYQALNKGQNDVFVTKLDPTGTIVQYSTYIGGSLDDVALGIAVDPSGDAYITGRTFSVISGTSASLYPINTGSFPANATQLAFVTELNPTGNALVYSTVLGAGLSQGNAITLDSSGNAYVGGYVSTNGLTTPATGIQGGLYGGGTQDGFVAQIAQGGTVTYSAYVGGAASDSVNAIALDSGGNIYVAGVTASYTTFPINNSAVLSTASTGTVGFAAKINAGFTKYNYSGTFGAGGETAVGIALDTNNDAYIVGNTTAVSPAVWTPTPTGTNNAIPGVGDLAEGFLVCLSNDGKTQRFLDYGTASSATLSDAYTGVALDEQNNVYVTGTQTNLIDNGTIQNSTGANLLAASGTDGFLVRYLATVNPNTTTGASFTPTASAFTNLIAVGGSGTDTVNGLALTGTHQVFLVGTSTSIGGPLVTPGSVRPLIASSVALPPYNSANILSYTTGLNDQGGSNVQGGTTGTTAANIGLFNVSGAVPTGTGAGVTPFYYGAGAPLASPGKNVLYAAGQYADLQVSAANLATSAAIGTAPGSVAPMNISASAVGACNSITATLNPASGGVNPFVINTINNTASGNLYQVTVNPSWSSVTNGTIQTTGQTTATLTFAGTSCDNAGSQALVVPVTLTVTTQLTAVPTPALTGLTETYNSGIISPLTTTPGALAVVPVYVQSGAGGPTYAVSFAGSSQKASSSGPIGISYPTNLVSFQTSNTAAIGTSSIPSVVASTNSGQVGFYVVVSPVVPTGNTNAGAALPPGTYTATINVTPVGQSAVQIPFSFTVTNGVSAGTSILQFPFTSATALPQQQAATVQVANQAGGPFPYTTSLSSTAPAACAATTSSCYLPGTSPLPLANVQILTGATGSVSSNSGVTMVVQVTPTGLATGTYGGYITINVSGAPSSYIAVNVVVGPNGLVVAQPVGGTLNVTLPGNYPVLAVPSSVLPNSEIFISDTQVSGAGQITVNNPLTNTGTPNSSTGVTQTGLPAGVLTFVSANGDCDSNTNGNCVYNPGSTNGYTINFNTVGLTVGNTYSGIVNFSGKNGSTTYTTAVAVNLTISSAAVVVAQSNPVGAASVPLTSLALTAVIGQAQVCTGGTGQAQGNPTFFTNGGVLGSITLTSSQTWLTTAGFNVTSGVTSATTSPYSFNGTGTGAGYTTYIQFCANPQLLGTTPGRYSATVTMTAPGAGNNGLVIPVTLLLSNTPGHIELSNAGVYRTAGTLGAFVLNLDQVTYNYAAANTLTRFFGLPGDQPVVGDWTGSGIVSLGIFRGGAWYFDLNNDGAFEPNEGPFYFGLPGDKAIVGDWTGSGSTKVGVFRCPASGVCTWYLNTVTQTAATLVPGANLYSPSTTLVYNYGLPGDQPVSSNWSQTGKVDQIGVFRCPTTGVCSWIVDTAGTGATFTTYSFGLTGDIAVVGDWGGNGQAKRIGVFRPSLGEWILDVNGSNTYAPNDIQGYFGLPGDIPVVGKWTMQ